MGIIYGIINGIWADYNNIERLWEIMEYGYYVRCDSKFE